MVSAVFLMPGYGAVLSRRGICLGSFSVKLPKHIIAQLQRKIALILNKIALTQNKIGQF
jgi:hypothetical protein